MIFKTFKRIIFHPRFSAFCNTLLQLFFLPELVPRLVQISDRQLKLWSGTQMVEMQENIAQHDNRALSLNLKTVLCSCERFVYLSTILISIDRRYSVWK